MGHKTRDIVIKAYSAGASGYRFEMWENNTQIMNETIVFRKPQSGWYKMKKVDHHRVNFELQNINTNLKFADQDNAFFIDVEGGTPGKGNLLDAWWVDARPSGTSIAVINMNLKLQRYKFTLNFLPDTTPDNGGPYIEYDPIGDNQNGGGSGSILILDYIKSAAVGLIAGLVAFWGARVFLPDW